ncbi:MAG: hypothetical protein BWY86_01073 [Candidatus Aminicenantes bacterium ADurb.Bin508]|nr:MAG: hypothetical protein BWY86_01073 [Candidatus Aminicenantes bacterium ADurb.Bin508]
MGGRQGVHIVPLPRRGPLAVEIVTVPGSHALLVEERRGLLRKKARAGKQSGLPPLRIRSGGGGSHAPLLLNVGVLLLGRRNEEGLLFLGGRESLKGWTFYAGGEEEENQEQGRKKCPSLHAPPSGDPALSPGPEGKASFPHSREAARGKSLLARASNLWERARISHWAWESERRRTKW